MRLLKPAAIAILMSFTLTLGIIAPGAEGVALRFKEIHHSNKNEHYYSKGYWSINQDNGTRYKVRGSVRKSRSGGRSAYWKATLQSSSGICVTGFSNVSVSCHLDYHKYGELQGTRFNTRYWNSSTRYKDVNPSAKTASAGMQTCVDIRFRVDSCSSILWTDGIQYRR